MSGARIADGTGASNVSTGVPVLDHLLAELARAGGFDLALEIEPDDPEAEVDAAGTALGRAVAPRLADGAHGEATAPADEALAMVVVERSGRPLVASNADLTGAGGLGTDLAARFLDRLAEEAGLTVHVRLIEGEDTGHALAAIFKALGVALARASGTAADPTQGDEMEKPVIRTEAAPAPFQGAPYNQAIVAGDFVFVAGQLGLEPGDAAVEGDIAQQTEQALAQSRRRSSRRRAARCDKLVKTCVFLDRPRRLPGDERGLRGHVGDLPPARSTFQVAKLPSGALVEIEAIAHRSGSWRRERGATTPTIRPVPTAIRRYVRSLGLDAYVVGGAVRDELLGIQHADEDFLVPGSTRRGCARRSSRTGASRTWRCTASSSACASTRATARSGRSSRPGSS